MGGRFYQRYASSRAKDPLADTKVDQAGMYPLKSLLQWSQSLGNMTDWGERPGSFVSLHNVFCHCWKWSLELDRPLFCSHRVFLSSFNFTHYKSWVTFCLFSHIHRGPYNGAKLCQIREYLDFQTSHCNSAIKRRCAAEGGLPVTVPVKPHSAQGWWQSSQGPQSSQGLWYGLCQMQSY